jgi:hypothetical protein
MKLDTKYYFAHFISRGPLCDHGMEHPRVADGGDGLQIWRVAAYVFIKQSRTADKG